MFPLKSKFHEKAADRMPEGMRPSPFTDRTDWLGQGDLTFAVTNSFPSTPGHALVLPRDFGTYRFTDLARDEIIEHFRMLKFLTREFNRHFKPDGYNIGWNIGFHGGQSIAHAHMHIMPRYHAVNKAHGINPKGGLVRMPFPGLPDYFNRDSKSEDRKLAWQLLNEMPWITHNKHVFVVNMPRAVAVTPGHSIVLPLQSHASVLQCKEEEVLAQMDAALEFMVMQQSRSGAPDGYNLGWDIGPAAGQFMKQAYLHIIPRYKGDMDSPRGGIVRCIPQNAWPKSTDYYDKKNIGKDVRPAEKIVFPFHFWNDPSRSNTIDLKKELGIA